MQLQHTKGSAIVAPLVDGQSVSDKFTDSGGALVS